MEFEKIFILGLLCMAILLCGCSSKKASNLIKTPDKIIVYKDGKDYTIDKNDKDFNKIVELTNKRIAIDDLCLAKDVIDDSNVNEYKIITKTLKIKWTADLFIKASLKTCLASSTSKLSFENFILIMILYIYNNDVNFQSDMEEFLW